jgi:hypothetical protein
MHLVFLKIRCDTNQQSDSKITKLKREIKSLLASNAEANHLSLKKKYLP